MAMRAPKSPGVTLPEGPGERRGEREGAPAPEGLPTLQDLQPSEEQLRRAIGSREMDYLGEVDEGEETLLNSKRWRFASFFNRVKRHHAPAIRRLGARGLQDLLLAETRVDRCVKGLEDGDPWEALLALIERAAGGLPATRGTGRPAPGHP